jgi:hypothetical protein
MGCYQPIRHAALVCCASRESRLKHRGVAGLPMRSKTPAALTFALPIVPRAVCLLDTQHITGTLTARGINRIFFEISV